MTSTTLITTQYLWKYDGFITTGPICWTLIRSQNKLDSFRAPTQPNRPSVSNTLPVTSSFPLVFSCTSSFLSFYLCLRPFSSWRLLRSSCLCFMNKLQTERKRTVKWRLTRRIREVPSCFFRCSFPTFASPLGLLEKPSSLLSLLFKCEVDSIAEFHSCLRIPHSGTFCRAGQACHQTSQEIKAWTWFLLPFTQSVNSSHLHLDPNILLLPFELCRNYSSPSPPFTDSAAFWSEILTPPSSTTRVWTPLGRFMLLLLFRVNLLQSQNLPMECSSQNFTRNHFTYQHVLISFRFLSWRKFQKQEKRVHHIFLSHVQSTPTQKTTTRDSNEWWVSKRSQV